MTRPTAKVTEEVTDRDDGLRVDECLGDRERLRDRIGTERLLDEHGRRVLREELEHLHLKVAPLLGRAAERGRRTDDERVRALVVLHRRDKVFERVADARVAVRGFDERGALDLEALLRDLLVRVDDRDNFQARAELSKGFLSATGALLNRNAQAYLVLETERVVPRTCDAERFLLVRIPFEASASDPALHTLITALREVQ